MVLRAVVGELPVAVVEVPDEVFRFLVEAGGCVAAVGVALELFSDFLARSGRPSPSAVCLPSSLRPGTLFDLPAAGISVRPGGGLHAPLWPIGS